MQVPGWCVGKDRVFWHPSEGSPLTSLPIVQLNPVPSVSVQLSHMQTEPSQSPAQSHEAPRTIDDHARKAKSCDLGLDFSLRWVWRTHSHQIWFTLVQAGLERAWGSEVCVDLPGRSSHARECKYTRAPAPTHPFLFLLHSADLKLVFLAWWRKCSCHSVPPLAEDALVMNYEWSDTSEIIKKSNLSFHTQFKVLFSSVRSHLLYTVVGFAEEWATNVGVLHQADID